MAQGNAANTGKLVPVTRTGSRLYFRVGGWKVGARLTACFLAIVLVMLLGDTLAMLEFERVESSAQHLNQADQKSLAIMRVYLDVVTFRETLTDLANDQNPREFVSRAAFLRDNFLTNVTRAEQTLSLAPDVNQNPMILIRLQTVRAALSLQVDAMSELVKSRDWEAVRFRLAGQVQPVIGLSSLLVADVEQEVAQERAHALDSAQRARHQLYLVLPLTALLILLIAAMLGWYATRRISKPLAQLDAAARALGRGEIGHEVEVSGSDEFAALASAFNYASQELRMRLDERKRAEEAARRSERELRVLIDTIPAVAGSSLPDGAADFVNRRWQEFTGLPAEGSLGWNWEALIHPDDRARFLSSWNAAVQTGETIETEMRMRRADGEYCWLLIRDMPLRDEQGNIIKWYGVGVDIEDRKRAETLLAAEKRILEMVAKQDSLADILDSLCRFVEEQATSVLASILLTDGNRLRHGGAPSLPKAYTDAIDGSVIGPSAGSCGTAAFRGEQVIVRDIASDPLWTEYRGLALSHSLGACWSTPIFSSEGKVIATFAMYYREPRSPSVRDLAIIEQVTHLAGVAIQAKLTQQKLREAETRFRIYVDHATDAFFVHDESGKIVDVNRQACESLGYTREELIGRMPRDLDAGLDDAMLQQLVNRVNAGETVEFKTAHRRKDASVFPVEVRARPFDYRGQRLALALVRDITERKRAEQEGERLRGLESDLAHMNRVSMMGELGGSLAHEIKQPITAAISNAQACLRFLDRDHPDLPEALEASSAMIGCANRAADIIDRVRSLSRKGTPQRELVDINEAIKEIAALLKPEAIRRSVTVCTTLAENLPSVMGDRIQLQQVVMNLMLNGIEALRDSPGELSITTKHSDNGQVLVCVSDTGVGLQAGEVDRIFDAFFTTKPQGTGMGLAISRSIVESHGGHLSAKPNSLRGATFEFALPVRT